MAMPFKPQIGDIEKIEDEETRIYSAIGAVVLTAAAIDMAVLSVASRLMPVPSSLTAAIFDKSKDLLQFVDVVMAHYSAEQDIATWDSLRERLRKLRTERNLSAHGHLNVEPRFEFVGVGAFGTLAATGFDFAGVSVSLDQHPDLVAAGKEPMSLTFGDLMDHLRKQAQLLADIRNFAARLERLVHSSGGLDG